MDSGRRILLDRLHRLMDAEGLRQANNEWDITALHGRVKGSKRWLYRLVRGEVNFSIDAYERVLFKGFGLPFAFVLSGIQASPLPRDVEDLRTALTTAIDNAKTTGTFEAFQFALTALFDKVARDRALFEKTRPREPSPPIGPKDTERGAAPSQGRIPATTIQKRKRHAN